MVVVGHGGGDSDGFGVLPRHVLLLKRRCLATRMVVGRQRSGHLSGQCGYNGGIAGVGRRFAFGAYVDGGAGLGQLLDVHGYIHGLNLAFVPFGDFGQFVFLLQVFTVLFLQQAQDTCTGLGHTGTQTQKNDKYLLKMGYFKEMFLKYKQCLTASLASGFFPHVTKTAGFTMAS